MKINNTTIGINRKPFIIAEMSGNHNQSLSKALKIVEASVAADVNAIKIQTYTAESSSDIR